MSDISPLHSPLWYRVAELRPRLLARVRLHRHRYRGETWYLLQDPATGQVHRFTPAARLVLAAMDGNRDADALWRLAQRRLGEEAPTQDEIIRLLGQLHAADLLATDVPPDVLELFERGRKAAATKRRRSWMNPLALRVPLWDPGAFLDRWAPCWRWIWGRGGALLWCAVVLPALLLLPPHWPELTGNLSDRVLQADNLLLLLLVFPLIKALHELGHATATHARGGEVHDMGVMLLVLMPVPYVDASAANVLPSRWSRALVGAAGMVVELFIAALAFFLWLVVEPGMVRAVCFNIMLVAGVSTLVFNGNPLLRYDAYYILADLAELPNLAQRAPRYWGYLAERYLLRGRQAESSVTSRSERAWLIFYGSLSSVYRVFVTLAIAVFVGSRFFFIGVLLALWALGMMVLVPLVRALAQINVRSGLRERRARLFAAIGGATATVAFAVMFVPLPFRLQAQGVVWLPEQASLSAGASGFVQRLVVQPGTPVRTGLPLVQSTDPDLEAQLRLHQARVAELEATHHIEFVANRARAEIVREQLLLEQLALERVQERARGLVTASPSAGVFTLARPADLPGRFHRKGELIGYVLGPGRPTIRVVLGQLEVDAVLLSTRQVDLRLADDVPRVIPGRIVRQVPAGTDNAPSKALLVSGGGGIAGDPRDPQGRKTLERIFEIDIEPMGPLEHRTYYGQRVYVRFDLHPEPLGRQLYRHLRQLFLTHFNV